MAKKSQDKKTKSPYENELRAAYERALTYTGLMFCESQFSRICDAFRAKTRELISKDAETPWQLTPEQFVDEYMDRPGEHILNKLHSSGLYSFVFDRHQV